MMKKQKNDRDALLAAGCDDVAAAEADNAAALAEDAAYRARADAAATHRAIKQASEPWDHRLDHRKQAAAKSGDGVNCSVCGKFVPDDGSIHSDEAGNVGCAGCCGKPAEADNKEEERKAAFLAFVNNNRAGCDADIVYGKDGLMTGIRFTGVEMGALEFNI